MTGMSTTAKVMIGPVIGPVVFFGLLIYLAAMAEMV